VSGYFCVNNKNLSILDEYNRKVNFFLNICFKYLTNVQKI